MSLNARKLREARKLRIEARKKKNSAKSKPTKRVRADGEEDGGEEMPEWLEEDINNGDEPAEGMDPMMGAEDDMPPADLEEEPELPADEPEEDASVHSAFNYNPIYQKPSKLGSGTPKGGFHYWGPPPDAGTSYGFYTEGGVGIIAPKAKKVFSPVSGKVMKFLGDLDIDALASVLSVADQMTQIDLGSNDSRMTSAPIGDKSADPLFDAQTGLQVRMDESTAEEEDGIDDDGDGIPDWEDPDDGGTPPAEGSDDEDEDDIPLPQLGDEEGGEEELPLEGSDDGDEDDLPGAENPDDEEELPLDPDAESVEYEALQSLDEIDEPVSEGDVHMTLFDEGTAEAPGADPFWNIDVGGAPVARVHLKDQPKPDEIRKVFCSADYYRGVSGAISKVGLKTVLKQIKARVWANKVEQTKLATDIRAKVSAEAQERVKATTKNMMKELLNRIALVCAGMDKNFFKDVGNPLKEALWGEMHEMGIANPSPLIEAAFRKGSTPYFQTVIAKAVEYLEFEPKALEQIRSTIGEMDIVPAGDETVGDEIPEIDLGSPDNASTLSDRLAASSVSVAGVSGFAGNPFGEHKETLASELKLGGTGPSTRR